MPVKQKVGARPEISQLEQDLAGQVANDDRDIERMLRLMEALSAHKRAAPTVTTLPACNAAED